jgi:carbamoyltransferase
MLSRRLNRSEFMPFAPVTTEELAPDCFKGASLATARFMTMCVPCTPFLRERCPAVVHVDGTARPQVVCRADNPDYHETLSRYAAKTGNPALINTSFNHHEEPIVLSPEDAVRSLVRGNVDILLAGRLLIQAGG